MKLVPRRISTTTLDTHWYQARSQPTSALHWHETIPKRAGPSRFYLRMGEQAASTALQLFQLDTLGYLLRSNASLPILPLIAIMMQSS